MARWICPLCLSFVIAGAACAAQNAPRAGNANDQAGQPAASAQGRLDEQSTVDDILDALHEVGKDVRTLQATIVLTDIDGTTGDENKRPGEVYLQRGEDGVAFRAVLKGVLEEGADGKLTLRPEKIEYVLKGDELADRNYKTRTEVRRKLPPDAAKRDLLKLGEGPFPLPIGQTKQSVHEQFKVTEVDPTDPEQNEMDIAAPEGTRRLRLTPKEGTALADDFSWIELDVNLADGMPRQVITLDKTGANARVTDLRSIKINQPLPEGAMEMEAIDRKAWNVIYEELPAPPAEDAPAR